MIDPLIKDDIHEAQARLVAWWQREDIGRPAILARAAREGLARAVSRIPVPESLTERWTNPEYHLRRANAVARGTFWGGEMIPYYFVWTGAECMASALGAKAILADTESVWWEPCVSSWDKVLPLRCDWQADWWQRMRVLALELTRGASGAYVPAVPDVGAPGDIVAAIRGTEAVCTDIFDSPEQLKAALKQVTEIWEGVMEEVYAWVNWEDLGSVAEWTGIWHPKRAYPTQNDISALVSAEQFREFFLPWVAAQCRKVEGAIYHLDGPEALSTVDALLEIPEIRVIEWTPGARQDDSTRWLDLYGKIQGAGKNLLLFPGVEEVEFLCRHLSRVGLMLHVTGCESVEQAQQIVAKAYEWSQGQA